MGFQGLGFPIEICRDINREHIGTLGRVRDWGEKRWGLIRYEFLKQPSPLPPQVYKLGASPCQLLKITGEHGGGHMKTLNP